MEPRVYSSAFLALFTAVYLAHLIDERCAPGLITGLVLCTPLAVATLWRARSALSRRDIVRGLVVGVLSFQPFWHFALVPVLSSGPAA